MGELRSFVTAFFNLVPLPMSESNAPRPAGAFGGPLEGGGGGGGPGGPGGGGGGPGLLVAMSCLLGDGRGTINNNKR